MVGGQLSSSCGVLNALPTRKTSGSSIRTAEGEQEGIDQEVERLLPDPEARALAPVGGVAADEIGGTSAGGGDAHARPRSRSSPNWISVRTSTIDEEHDRLGGGVADAVVAEAVLDHVEDEHADETAGRALRVGGEDEGLRVDVEADDTSVTTET